MADLIRIYSLFIYLLQLFFFFGIHSYFEQLLMEMDAAVPVEANLAIITSLTLTPWHEQAF